MNGGPWGIRNRGGGSYNPDVEEHVEKMMEQEEEDIDQSGRVIGPEAQREREARFKKGKGLLHYLWCIVFHPKYHVQASQQDGFGVYCRICDVKW